MDVQFQWRFYRPRTELLPSSLSQSGGSQELLPVSSTIESKCSAFSVKPQHGTCKARERKIFVFSFLSDKVVVVTTVNVLNDICLFFLLLLSFLLIP